MKPKTKSAAPARTSADVEAEIAAHQAAHDAAVAEVARLQGLRPAMLLDASPEGEDALDELELAIRRAERTVERKAGDEGSIAALRLELREVQYAEGQARRMALYKEAEKAAEEYRRIGLAVYPAAARQVVAAIMRQHELAAIIERANRDKPRDPRFERDVANAYMPVIDVEPCGRPLAGAVYLPGYGRNPDIFNPRLRS